MDKENVKFSFPTRCFNVHCNKEITKGFMHIVNRYLTYKYCDKNCYLEAYGILTDGGKC